MAKAKVWLYDNKASYVMFGGENRIYYCHNTLPSGGWEESGYSEPFLDAHSSRESRFWRTTEIDVPDELYGKAVRQRARL